MASQSYKIGKIFGIDIEIHWTLIALLIGSYALSAYLLGVDSAGSVLVFFFLLFACVLLHELAHSFIALRNRVKVGRIILYPMGGLSVIDQIGLDPRTEFNIAIAGPAMNILLGSFFGALVVLAPPGVLNQTLQLLFEINMILGVFNILPAFPTDGGRVFRSYLERRYNQYKATMITIRVGNVVLGLIVLGTLIYTIELNGPFIVFLWNLFIVFFLYSGAQAEKQLMELKQHTIGMHVSEVTNKHFVFVKPEHTVQRLYGTVRKMKTHLLITKLGNEYAFVNLLRREKLKRETTAREIAMPIPNIRIDANIIDALEKMEVGDIGIAAVTSGSKLVGIVTLSHLQAFLSLHVLRLMKQK